MELICDKNVFAASVSNVVKASSSKSNMPVLEGILLKAKGNILELCCFDLQIAIKKSINANIIEEGEVVLSANTLCSIANSLKSETITIKTDEKLVTVVKGGRSKFKIVGMDAKEFPDLPSVSDANKTVVDSAVLKAGIKQILFAVSSNTSNPVFTGVSFELKDDNLTLCATDTYKLVKRKVPAKGELLSCIIPAKELNTISKLLPDTSDNISIFVDKGHALLTIEYYTVILRLISGKFPDFESIEKRTSTTCITINRNNLLETIRRVSLVNLERLPKPLICSINNETISFSIQGHLGVSEDDCDLLSFDGESLKIGINSRYLESILVNTTDEEVKIEFSGNRGPVFIKPANNSSFFAFMAPMMMVS